MTFMLKDLAEIETRFGEATVGDVRKAANLLLRKQFVFAGDRGATHAYEALISPRFRSYFSALFDALGYDLRISESEQWVGILPDADLEWFPRMPAHQTIVLLILALAWQEEVNRGGAGARAVVATTLNALFERYRDLSTRGRKETLNTARFEDVLREFERRGLVDIGPLDPEVDDKQVDIRPMVHLLVDGNALDRLDRFAAEAEAVTIRARKLAGEAETTEPSEEDEEALA